MNIFNVTKGAMAIFNVDNRDSFSGKTKGLLSEDQARAIYFRTRWGIHTLFMKFPIDIVVLDESQIVRVIRESLRPWKFLFWNPGYPHVFELPEGSVREKGISLGDRLEFQV